MLIKHWLENVYSRLAFRGKGTPRPSQKRRPISKRQRGVGAVESLEERVLLAGPQVVTISPNTGGTIENNTTLDEQFRELTIQFSEGQEIDPATLGGIRVVRTGGDGVFGNINDATGNLDDVVVTPGFIGVGDRNNEVIVRFAENLPDDLYQIIIIGDPASESPYAGPAGPLANVGGELFQDGSDFVRNFELDLGAKVEGVVPQPIIRETLIQVTDPNSIQDGDTFLLSIAGQDFEFEFDTNSDGSTNPDAIVIASINDPITLATRIRNSIETTLNNNFAGPEQALTVSQDPTNRTIISLIGTAFTPQVSTASDGLELSDGALLPQRDRINVYFNTNDPLDPVTATVASNYRLVDAVTGATILPSNVLFYESSNVVSLQFAAPIQGELYNLRIGQDFQGGAAITPFNEMDDDNSSFNSATDLGELLSSAGRVINALIEPQDAFVLLPPEPGGNDEPGHRDVTSENHLQFNEDGTPLQVPKQVPVINYNFQTVYGFNAGGVQQENTISDLQKQRIREIFDLFSYYAGVQFVETESKGLTIAVGQINVSQFPGGPQVTKIEPRAGDQVEYAVIPIVQTNGALTPFSTGLLIMDGNEPFNQDNNEYGGFFFRQAMEGIGQAIGLGSSFELAAIMGEETVGVAGANPIGEPVFPGDHDITHLRRLYPRHATDIDLYQFNLTETGTLNAQTFAQRLVNQNPGDNVPDGTPEPSLLNTNLILFDANGNVLSRNDDYFSKDSLIEVMLQAGTYYIGVSAAGNDDYDPSVTNSGFGGRSDGEYELRLGFTPQPSSTATILDADGNPTPLDGDADGVAGGEFSFSFRGDDGSNTLYVDVTNTQAGDGSADNPYRSLADAFAAATPGTNVRVSGNVVDTPYIIGVDNSGNPVDGAQLPNLEVPEGVTLMIDAGAIFKLSNANIDVGSESALVSREGAALQVLGTTDDDVIFTSYRDDQFGGDSDGVGPSVRPDDWGGLVFREDSDFDNFQTFNTMNPGQAEAVFLNYVNHATILFGGGLVATGSGSASFDPITLFAYSQDEAIALDSLPTGSEFRGFGPRPTLSFNTIFDNAGSAISANPNNFSDTLGRIGPDIHDNTIQRNTINGLFIRVNQQANQALDKLEVGAQFDDTDITHVVTQNLIVAGNPGGPVEFNNVTRPRFSGRLTVDPGVIVKLGSSRIEAERGGAQVIAEGTDDNQIIFTSLFDDSYGGSGTFDTNNDAPVIDLDDDDVVMGPDITTVAWVSQGPTQVTNGQVEGLDAQGNPVSGAVHTALAHPTDPDILYIGAVNGGIWRTTNATASEPTWEALTDTIDSLSIGALQYDLSDPTFNTIVAGIGRFSSFARVGGERIGILRTTDGGDTWTVLDGGGVLVGKNISGIAANGNVIVVSVNTAGSVAETGIYRSTNGGATFAQVSVGDGTGATGLPLGITYDLVADPNDPNTLYTGVAFAGSIGGGQSGIYKSIDGGATWASVSDAVIDALISEDNTGIPTSNIEMSVGENDNVYVAIINQGALAGLFRSGDGGTAWTQLDTPSTNEGGTDVGLNPRGAKGPGTGSPILDIAGGQGAIHFSIVADPTNDFIVYVGGDRQPRADGDTGSFPNSIGANNFTGRLFRVDASLTAGSQATALTHNPSTNNNSAPHADSREMVFAADGTIIEVDDGGVYRRTNPQTTGDWFSVNGNLSVAEFHDIGYDSLNDVIFAGTQDNGNQRQISPGSLLWDVISQGDGGDIAIDDTSTPGSVFVYLSAQNLGGFRRVEYDATGTVVNIVSIANPIITDPQFANPVVLNAVDPTRLVVGGSGTLYESVDQGNTFTAINGVGANGGLDQDAIAYGGTLNGTPNLDVLWTGFGSQVLVRTMAGGTLANTNYAGGFVQDVFLDPDDFNTAFVIDDNSVFVTTDTGATYADVTGNLPTDGLRTLTYIPGQSDYLVVGGRDGVFVMDVAAPGIWTELGIGLPEAIVSDSEYDATDDILVIGTMGRGAFSIDGISAVLANGGGGPVIPAGEPADPGDWAGIVFNATSSGSFNNVRISYGGGGSPLEGDFAEFNPMEIHQAEVRIVNSDFRNNADGIGPAGQDLDRNGRGENSEATIFVRGAQPIIMDNDFRNNDGNTISINANALIADTIDDTGNVTGFSYSGAEERALFTSFADNHGPLVRINRITGQDDLNAGIDVTNGMEVRGTEGLAFSDPNIAASVITTDTVWDDTDIPHVVRDEIRTTNMHTYGSLLLQSSATASLVVKLLGSTAGFTADGEPLDIDDRIGGTVQIVGAPGFPVVLTSLNDDSVAAGFRPDGFPSSDTNGDGSTGAAPSAGDWRSIQFNQYANDRNVDIVLEAERGGGVGPDTNAQRTLAEPLGLLASNGTKGSDANNRAGFEIHGIINPDGNDDRDTYSFIAETGTEVWIDIDRTDSSLDTFVEVMNSAGVVIASSDSNNVLNVDRNGNPRPNAIALPLIKDSREGGDFYTTNPKDAGMRVVLPGIAGDDNIYYVRVSSRGTPGNGQYTSGEYELQIRLQQRDEQAGSTVRFADIRYSTDGIEVSGLPSNSPLAGEGGESGLDGAETNDTFGAADTLGNLLATNRGTLSVAGILPNDADVDFYRFSVNYQDIDPTFTGSTANDEEFERFAVTFDIDYAEGFAGGNMTLFVFDEQGNLVLMSQDSRNAADVPAPLNGADTDDLTRGTNSSTDPFLGPVELPQGDYIVAVATDFRDPTNLNRSSRVPQVLTQFTDANSAFPLTRVEPNVAVNRIVEDHIDGDGQYTLPDEDEDFTFFSLFDAQGDQTDEPNSDLTELIDTRDGEISLGSSIVPWHLGDVSLFVAQPNGNNTDFTIVNPFTGATQVVVGRVGERLEDITIRMSDGQLIALDSQSGNTNDSNTGNFIEIDTTNINNDDISQFTDAITFASSNAGIQTFEPDNSRSPAGAGAAGVGFTWTAITPTESRDLEQNDDESPGGPNNGYFAIGQRNDGQGIENVLYQIEAGGNASGGTRPAGSLGQGAGTNIRERGILDTLTGGSGDDVLIVPEAATFNAITGVTNLLINDGDRFTAGNGAGGNVTYEMNLGTLFNITINQNTNATVADGDLIQYARGFIEFDTGELIVVNNGGSAINENDFFDVTAGPATNRTTIRFEFADGPVGTLPGGINRRVVVTRSSVSALSAAQLTDFMVNLINNQSEFGASLQAIRDLGGETRINLVPQAGAPDAVADANFNAGAFSIEGTSGTFAAGAIRIPVEETFSGEEIVAALTVALAPGNDTRFEGGGEGTVFNIVDPSNPGFPFQNPSFPNGAANYLTATDLGGIDSNSDVAVNYLISETATEIRDRMVAAIDSQTGTTGVDAVPLGNAAIQVRDFTPGVFPEPIFVRALTDDTGDVPPGPFIFSGVAPGGTITGASVVDGILYVVTDEGGLYTVNNPGATESATLTYLGLVTDPLNEPNGITFTGLTAGPERTEDGRYEDVLFATSQSGRLYAIAVKDDALTPQIETPGTLLPVFVNAQTSADLGLFGVQGLVFSNLTENLWHLEGDRFADQGHGVDTTFDRRRIIDPAATDRYDPRNPETLTGDVGQIGGSSLHFGRGLNDSYNFAGGAYGTVETNTFDLTGYSALDQPALYFNYYLDTENQQYNPNANTDQLFLDSFRTFITDDSGQWELLTSNNEYDPFDILRADELNNVSPFDVQQTFDIENQDAWRQVRVDLSPFAGRENLRLRFDFSTFGSMGTGVIDSVGEELRAVNGWQIENGDTFDVFDPNTFTTTRFEFDNDFTVVFPTGSRVDEGDTITVEDTITTTFEFTLDAASYSGPNVPVEFSKTDTAQEVARAFRDAVRIVYNRVGQNIDDAGWNLTSNPDIPNSTTRPHVSVTGTGDGTFDYYSFTVQNAGDVGTFDIDDENFDTELFLFDSNGNLLAFNDDGDDGDGSGFTLASFLQFTFTSPGQYYLGVGEFNSNAAGGEVTGNPPDAGDSYTLHFSLDNHPLNATGDDPLVEVEPNEINNGLLVTEELDQPQRVNLFSAADILNVTVNAPQIALEGQAGFVSGNERIRIHSGMNRFDDSTPTGFFNQIETVNFDGLGAENPANSDVMTQIKDALVNVYTDVNADAYWRETVFKNYREVIRIIGLDVIDAGPLGLTEINRSEEGESNSSHQLLPGFSGNYSVAMPGDSFGSRANNKGLENNNFEGVYIDDIIIGFAGRGEFVTGSDIYSQADNTTFTPATASQIETGLYQLEIRRATEYDFDRRDDAFEIFEQKNSNTNFDSSLDFTIDIKDLQTGSDVTVVAPRGAEIAEGQTFLVSDGVNTFTFEFAQTALAAELARGNTLGNSSLFTLTNTGDTNIASVDLTLPFGLVFDINDVPLSVSSGGTLTGINTSPSFLDGIGRVMRVTFSNFEPGETVSFGLDVDQNDGDPNNGEETISGENIVGTEVLFRNVNGVEFLKETFQPVPDLNGPAGRITGGSSVRPGNVAVPFLVDDRDYTVAAAIRDAINRVSKSNPNPQPLNPLNPVLLDVVAGIDDGTDASASSSTSNRINLFGAVDFFAPNGVNLDLSRGVTGTVNRGIRDDSFASNLDPGPLGAPLFAIGNSQYAQFLSDLFTFTNDSPTGEWITSITFDLTEAQIRSNELGLNAPVFDATATNLAIRGTTSPINLPSPQLQVSADGSTATINILDSSPFEAGEEFNFGIPFASGIPIGPELIDTIITFEFENPITGELRTVQGRFLEGTGSNYAIFAANTDAGTGGNVAEKQSPLSYIVNTGIGDANLEREQGQLVISQNRITDTANSAISVDAGVRASGSSLAPLGVPINFSPQNNQNLAPGVKIVNNVVATFGQSGISLSGDPNTGTVANAVVPFARVINNTVYGGQTPTGTGISVTNNASPTILNNILANLTTGIVVDGSSNQAGTVTGFNLYSNNGSNANIGGAVFGSNAVVGTQDIVANPSQQLFVDPSTNNFYPADGSPAIDSATNSLPDRASITSFAGALGIPESTILAPDTDRFGQTRVDDPDQNPPFSGGTEEIIKDRGAVERADFNGPTVELVDPDDNGPLDLENLTDTVVRLDNPAQRRFLIKFNDLGIGIDDDSVTEDKFTVLFNDGSGQRPLALTDDYLFFYNSNTNEVTLAPVAGLYPFGTYTILIDNSVDNMGAATGIRDEAGNPLIGNQGDGTVQFTIQLLAGGLSISDSPTITEGDFGESLANFTVTLSSPSASTVSVQYQAMMDPTGLNPATVDEDFRAITGTVTFNPGETTRTITIPIIGDSMIEPDETFQVMLSSPVNARFVNAGDEIGLGTIIDDDPKFSFPAGVSDPTAPENSGEIIFQVALLDDPKASVAVDFTTQDLMATDAATAGADYFAINGTLILQYEATNDTYRVFIQSAGSTEELAPIDASIVTNLVVPISVELLDDSLVEAAERFNLVLSNARRVSTDGNGQITGTLPGTIGVADGVATGTITDNEPSVSIFSATVVEGEDGEDRFLDFRVEVTGEIVAPFQLNFMTVDGTATGFPAVDADYQLQDTMITVTDAGTYNVRVKVFGDDIAEGPTETFSLIMSLENPGSANLVGGLNNQVVVSGTIIDDDTPAFTIGDVTVIEGDDPNTPATAVFTVTLLNRPATGDYYVDYQTVPGTATEADYTAVMGRLEFLEGGSDTQTISVTITNDDIREGDEEFTVLLTLPDPNDPDIMTPPAVPAILLDDEATGTILDDDSPKFMVNDVTVVEGQVNFAEFLVTMTELPLAGETSTVRFQTRDGSAIAGLDYQATSGTLTFTDADAAGQIVRVPIRIDDVDELFEDFELVLSDAMNAGIIDGIGVGTILDRTTTLAELIQIPNQSMLTTEDVRELTLPRTDATGQIITYTAVSDNNQVVVTVMENRIILDPAPNFIGTADITVTATTANANATDTFRLTVLSRPEAVITDQPVDRLAINGFPEVVEGDFDGGDGGEDLFFYNPLTGANRFLMNGVAGITFVTNAIDPTLLNGNDFTQLVAGDFGGAAGFTDLFFYNPLTGKNRMATVQATGVLQVETNIVDPTAINGNDFTNVSSGSFRVSATNDGDDLFFWHRATGKNRIVAFNSTTPTPTQAAVQTNFVDPAAINGNDFDTVVTGNFDDDGLDDLFFWNATTGKNRHVTLVQSGGPGTAVIQDMVLTNVIDTGALNGNDFVELTVADYDGDGDDDLFFWNPQTGRNRAAFVDNTNGISYGLETNGVASGAVNGGAFQIVIGLNFTPGVEEELFFFDPIGGFNRLASRMV